MNRKIWPLAVIAAVMICRASETASAPASGASQASDLTADQLIAKYEAARGGEQKLKGIQSVKMTGKWVNGESSPAPVAVTIAPGRYLRRIDQGSDVPIVQAVDGQAAWETSPPKGITKPSSMSDKDAARFRHLADPQGPLVNFRAKNNKIEVLGKQSWRSSQVYKLKVTFADGGVNYIYLDAKSFLPVRVVSTLYLQHMLMSKEAELEQVYEDFRDVDGVKWPFIEKASAPEVNFATTTSWEKIEVNKPVDASAFKQPKG
ncbi:MAG TPA: hypothetical protein VH988_23590 [Thermoanaerobaculia bacterium]|jgi:hypothetical protein|nr:hypothetical protein [Thermoanaerobaculia bacterium]